MTRIVAAAWRARRADRLEAALVGHHLADDPGDPQAALGLGLMRDGNGPRALDTLVRYRGAALAELFRSLGALKALQAGDLPAAPCLPASSALAAPARTLDRTPCNEPLPCLDRQRRHPAAA